MRRYNYSSTCVSLVFQRQKPRRDQVSWESHQTVIQVQALGRREQKKEERLALQCSSQKVLSRPLGNPCAKVTHRKSPVSPRNGSSLASPPHLITGQEKPLGSMALVPGIPEPPTGAACQSHTRSLQLEI